MSRDTYEDIAQNLTDKMKRTLTPANDGVFSKHCLGVVTAKGQIRAMKEENCKLSNEAFLGRIKELPQKQQEGALHMFKAAKRKNIRGMRYSKEWILECLIMRMKGPKLYEDMRRQKILVLPSKVTLQKYMRSYRTGFGFNAKVMSVLKEKTSTIDAFKRHGGLIVDEMKLSENLSVSSSGHIEGFVDIGQLTPATAKHKVADHGMVIMFVPFNGKWTQILASFATQGNMKGNLLSKVMLEAVILAEKAGLFVDFITCDGAAWNRNMWATMGIHATVSSTKCKVQHPVDNKRSLHFISDFPHLVKCIRNGLLKSGFNTPTGPVSLHPVKEALKMDGSNVTLQAMPGITTRHIQPNNFEKMRVTFAYQLFSDTVLNGLRLYRNDIEAICGSIQPVLTFFGMMRDLIEIMSSRFPAKALRPDSAAVDKLLSFLAYLVEWEVHAAGRGGFLSASTTVGLRVTIASVLSLLDYLSQQLEYKFIMTSRLSQDPLENFFGIARQASGCNTHPTPQQFLITVSCLTFYSLAKSVTNGNAEPGCFSAQELHHESIMDVISLIKSQPRDSVGCAEHAEVLTAEMVAFFVTTRLHFFVKSLNRASVQKRETAKYLKLSRCT
ncbi:hypothetical protein HPB49_008804 [Dermacentor silvarum]|uniref:Uncharacterized protein n=1 Tax=Dermacentor silvarum TaxID=543639 RepID=A0ACB8DXX9_DERSI|nr:hypothetical protein HPB49_008804 [Dermacentor silvarum]